MFNLFESLESLAFLQMSCDECWWPLLSSKPSELHAWLYAGAGQPWAGQGSAPQSVARRNRDVTFVAPTKTFSVGQADCGRLKLAEPLRFFWAGDCMWLLVLFQCGISQSTPLECPLECAKALEARREAVYWRRDRQGSERPVDAGVKREKQKHLILENNSCVSFYVFSIWFMFTLCSSCFPKQNTHVTWTWQFHPY